jgi:alcohol dehydrogenase class IV
VQFEFATATRIVFGRDSLVRLPDLVSGLGARALLVTGRSGDRSSALAELLDRAGLERVAFTVAGEPTVDLVADGVARARETGCDLVVGFGGGSAIDTAKAIAAMLGNQGQLFDYLEVIGAGRPLQSPSRPWIAIPTTAGTGSEVTRNAVLASPAHRVKVSLRSPLMLARVALVDPALTDALPPAVTASAGLDALSQLVEPFTSARANPLTDAICREGMACAARSLLPAYRDGPGDNRWARDEMSLAALFGGLALANAGLGAVHGFAAPIGGAFPAPHGAVCGRLLPAVVSVNVRALRERAPGSEALARYDEVGRILTGRPDAGADDAVAWIAELVGVLGVPRLGDYGVGAADIAALVDAGSAASSMQANPIRLERDELIEILERSL